MGVFGASVNPFLLQPQRWAVWSNGEIRLFYKCREVKNAPAGISIETELKCDPSRGFVYPSSSAIMDRIQCCQTPVFIAFFSYN
jgi:hypothetical protein